MLVVVVRGTMQGELVKWDVDVVLHSERKKLEIKKKKVKVKKKKWKSKSKVK